MMNFACLFTCDLFWNYPLKRNICGKVNPSYCWRMVESGRPTLHIVRRREQATQEAEREREREWGGRAWRELFTLDSWLLKCKDLDQIQIGTQAFNKKFRVWQIYSKVYTFPRCYRMNHNSVSWVTNSLYSISKIFFRKLLNRLAHEPCRFMSF